MRAPSRKHFSLKPSLLDRLTDGPSPGAGTGGAQEVYSWPDHMRAFRRDLSNLLNTRQRFLAADLEGCPEGANSILTYGFPRTASLEWMSEEQQARLAAELTALLRRFEPRLLGPRVTPVGIEGLGRVHFRIEGALRSDPSPVRVIFDTYLDLERVEYRLEG